MQFNGLTLVKPDYDFAYLEDNVEVYLGMVAAANIPYWDRPGGQIRLGKRRIPGMPLRRSSSRQELQRTMSSAWLQKAL